LSGPTVPLNVDLLGTYQVIATNTTTGCFSKSNAVTVKDSASNQLFVYPNPSSGVFQVRYYNQGNPTPTTERTLIIFDAKGAKVYSKRYPINAPYDKMNVNMTNAQHGLYFIELRDANGKRIASGKVTLQ
ncbi:MAG: T9SS type A sorting domain-containing protein, partial [Ferruginibacter sp.]